MDVGGTLREMKREKSYYRKYKTAKPISQFIDQLNDRKLSCNK